MGALQETKKRGFSKKRTRSVCLAEMEDKDMSTSIIPTLCTMGTIIMILYSIGHLVFQLVKKQPVVKIVWRSVINVIFICICVFITVTLSNLSTKVVSSVKDRCPQGEQITYGQALDHFLEDVDWRYFGSETATTSEGDKKKVPKQIIVEVKGKYPKKNDAEILLQFEFDPDIHEADDITDSSGFSMGYAEVNGEGMDMLSRAKFYEAAFRSYASEEKVPFNGNVFPGDTEEDDSSDWDGEDNSDWGGDSDSYEDDGSDWSGDDDSSWDDDF